jgi:spore coat assembly protein
MIFRGGSMSKLRKGDIVARKSYGNDIFFKVVDIRNSGGESVATLKGISCRIEADAPETDLEVQSKQKVREYRIRCDKAFEKTAGDVLACRLAD